MWMLLLLGFPVLEIWVLFRVGDQIGLANTFFALLASAVFGFGLIRSQGFFLLRNVQASLAKGEMPSKSIFHSILILLAGAFFMFPGYISDFIGLILLLPGSRHVVASLMQRKLEQKMREGSLRFQSFGGGFAGGFGARPRSGASVRDVSPLELEQHTHDVIDITPKKEN